MQTANMLPCPFCGEAGRIKLVTDTNTHFQWVECICGARGPESASARSAIGFWNQRGAVSALDK